MRKANEVDWVAVKNDYINTGIGQRKLAQKYAISYGTVRARAEKEKWLKHQKAQMRKISALTAQKTAECIIAREVDRNTRHMEAYDELLTVAQDILALHKDKPSKKDVYTLEKVASILERVQKGHTLGGEGKAPVVHENNLFDAIVGNAKEDLATDEIPELEQETVVGNDVVESSGV